MDITVLVRNAAFYVLESTKAPCLRARASPSSLDRPTRSVMTYQHLYRVWRW